jgi:hypothetical protein
VFLQDIGKTSEGVREIRVAFAATIGLTADMKRDIGDAVEAVVRRHNAACPDRPMRARPGVVRCDIEGPTYIVAVEEQS